MTNQTTAPIKAQTRDSVADEAMSKDDGKAPRPIPFDRLSADDRDMTGLPDLIGGTVLFHLPSKSSLYHTERAKRQRQTYGALLSSTLPAAITTLNRDGFGRNTAGYAGVFEHNGMTLAAAQAYAAKGYSVIDGHALDAPGEPTDRHTKTGKMPRGACWQSEGTTDPDIINSRWTGHGQYRENKHGNVYKFAPRHAPRNVCILTGEQPDSEMNLAVVDLDGATGLAWREANGDILPDTVEQRTGSGGTHLFYLVPKGITIQNSASAIASGVDIRADRGQIVAAPSIHPTGGFYHWREDHSPLDREPAPAPERLIELMQAASKKPVKNTTKRKARAALGRVSGGVPDGERPVGFDAWCASIGDGEGLRGFNGAIYSAAISYFTACDNVDDSDFETLRELLAEAVGKAKRDPSKDRSKYDTASYLDEQIAEAWAFIDAQDTDDRDDDETDADPEHDATADADADPDAKSDTRAKGSDSATGESASAEPDIKPRRQVSDPLHDDKLVKAGFIAGEGKKLDKNKDKVRTQMREAMREMFEFVVMEGGEARALLKTEDGKAPRILTKQGLRDMFANRTVAYWQTEKKVGQIHPATEFICDPDRVTYLGTQFEPDPNKADPLLFNLWSGFAVVPKEGDWSLLRDHVRNQIIEGNESDGVTADDLFNWLMMRYAHMFQFPGQKIGNAVVFKGEEGTGKTKLTEWLRTAIGASAHKIAQRKHLVGNFNGGLDARIYVVSEEAFFSGDKEAAGVVKDMITDDKIEVEKKGFESVTRSNYIRADFVSNEDWVVPTGENGDARRFLVLNVNNNQKQKKSFFKAIDKQMRDGGVEAMVYDLLHWNPADHGMDWSDLRTPPWTPARGEQATHGLTGPRARLKAILEVGVIQGRTADGESFYYDLSDDAETVVARIHLNAALTGGGKAYGGTGKKIQAAIKDMIGPKAASDTRVEVSYNQTGRTDDADAPTVMSKTVTFPPLADLSAEIAKRYK